MKQETDYMEIKLVVTSWGEELRSGGPEIHSGAVDILFLDLIDDTDFHLTLIH